MEHITNVYSAYEHTDQMIAKIYNFGIVVYAITTDFHKDTAKWVVTDLLHFREKIEPQFTMVTQVF